MWNIPIFPEQASTVAGRVDAIFGVVTGLAIFFAVSVAILIVIFAIRYRRGVRVERLEDAAEGRKSRPTWMLETTWIAIPFLMAMGVFVWGAQIFVDIYQFPPNGLDVYVVGRQWMWKFQHPQGQTEINTLHAPVDHTVRLTMISEDVIHSFYVPAFRIKRDVLPGYYTTLWFEATQPGEYHLFCAEYCGTEHARMVGTIIVMPQNQYQAWLSQRPVGSGSVRGVIAEGTGGGMVDEGAQTMAQTGEALFERLGCSTCHQMEGTGIGPSLVGVYGEPVELEDGQTIVADAQYIRDSIIDPNVHVVAGYSPVMPSYEGQVNEEELLQLVEYIRSLGEDGGTIPDESDIQGEEGGQGERQDGGEGNSQTEE